MVEIWWVQEDKSLTSDMVSFYHHRVRTSVRDLQKLYFKAAVISYNGTSQGL